MTHIGAIQGKSYCYDTEIPFNLGKSVVVASRIDRGGVFHLSGYQIRKRARLSHGLTSSILIHISDDESIVVTSPIDGLGNNKRTKWRLHNNGREIAMEIARRYADPFRKNRIARRRNLKAKYGLTVREYESIHVAQSGKCAICGRDENGRKLAVDHNHKTGEIRGLLCDSCNPRLGILEDYEFVLIANRYLAKFS